MVISYNDVLTHMSECLVREAACSQIGDSIVKHTIVKAKALASTPGQISRFLTFIIEYPTSMRPIIWFHNSGGFWCFFVMLNLIHFVAQELCNSIHNRAKNPICHSQLDVSVRRELCAPVYAEIQQPCGWKMPQASWREQAKNRPWISLSTSLWTVDARSICQLCHSICTWSHKGSEHTFHLLIVSF